jgi:dTDP-D-glucose 4,6-dehydratase
MVTLEEGLKKTIDWYVKTHSPKGHVSEKILMERD